MTCEGAFRRGYPPTDFPVACYLTIYLDGVRIWTWGQREPPNIESISVIELEGVEVYRGPSELPTAFQTTGSAGGAVLLWTRIS